MKIVNTVLVVALLALLGSVSAPGARADEWNKKTVMTFNQPVEIPGQILPAGTYTFKLLNSPSDRHRANLQCRWHAVDCHGADD